MILIERNIGGEIEDPLFGFLDHPSGVFITDPYSSTCSRFEVDPTLEYGLSASDIEWMAMLNGLKPTGIDAIWPLADGRNPGDIEWYGMLADAHMQGLQRNAEQLRIFMLNAEVMKHQAPGYNPPVHLPMFIAQWAHQRFLDGDDYSVYAKISELAYLVFKTDL